MRPNIVRSCSEETAGAFSRSETVHVEGTAAEGRTGQSACKGWLLLLFAKRVADGLAKPHETAFMTALMAADIPQMTTEEEVRSVANAVSALEMVGSMDASAALSFLESHDGCGRGEGGE